MEVILREAVEKLGHPGDIVKVSAGYARNFLLPRGIAYEATPGNKKRIAQEKATLEEALGIPTSIGNDANLAAMAERRMRLRPQPKRGVRSQSRRTFEPEE